MVRRIASALTLPITNHCLLLGALGGAALALGLALLQARLWGLEHDFWAHCLLPLLLGATAGGLALPRLAARWRQDSMITMCMHCHAVKNDGLDPSDQDAWQPSHRFLAASLGAEVSHGLCPLCKVEQYAQHLPPASRVSGPPRA